VALVKGITESKSTFTSMKSIEDNWNWNFSILPELIGIQMEFTPTLLSTHLSACPQRAKRNIVLPELPAEEGSGAGIVMFRSEGESACWAC
jgi:hypothetical protein